MAEQIGSAYVAVGADVSAFEAGMNQVQADLGKVAAAADAAAGRYTDAQGRMREANGRFVSAATLAAEAARNVGGSLGSLADTATRTGQTINQGLVSSFGAFDRAISPLQAGIGRLGESLKSIGSGLTTYVTLPLGLLAGAALSSYGKVDGLTRGLNALASQDVARQGATGVEAIGLAASATQARLKELQEIAKAPGIGFEQAVQGDIRLRAVGISAEQSAKILREFANAIALTGGGAGELNSVTVQLGQLSAKGKVLAQDLRPIIEAAPAVSQALQKLYGTVDSETISKSLEKQGKSSTDFVATLTDELAKIPRVAGGFSNALENALQGGQQDLARIGESINKAFNLEGILESVGSAVTKLTDYFTSLSPGVQRFVLGAAAVAAAAGPIVFGLGAIAASIPSVVAGLEVMGLASTAALGPIGIGVVAIAGAASLIINNWDRLVAYFTAGEGGQLFSNLAESISNSVAVISGAFGELSTQGDGSFGGLIAATGVLQAIFRDITVGLTSIANVASGTIGAIAALLSGDLTAAADQGKRALFGLVDPLAALLGFTVKGKEAAAAVREVAEADASLVDTLTSVGLEATHTAGLLETLRAKLKELKEQREKETTVAAIGVDTTQIKAIEEQIKKLEGVDKASKKAADAIAKLREQLANLNKLDGLLGDTPSQVQVLERRIATLTTGLKTLVDAGVSTGSKAFKGFVSDVVNSQQALDKLQASANLDLKPASIKSLVPKTLGDTLPQDVARLLGDYAKSAVPIELQIPIKVSPLIGGLSDIQKTLADETLRVSQAFSLASSDAQLFGGAFDDAGAKASALKDEIQNLLQSGLLPTSPAIQDIVEQYKTLAQQSIDTQGATSAVKGAIMDLASGISSAFSDALTGTQSIGDALLQTLLQTVGKLATELGGILLASGLGIEALKVSLATFSGIGAIAAGIGLLAIGGIASAAASNLGKSAGSGSIASAPKTNYNSSAASTNTPTIKVIAEFRLRGQDLVAVGRTQDYRVQRTN